MARTARNSAATKALIAQLDQKSTGRLTVGAGAAEISVYVMGGNLLAAETPDDPRQLVHLLQRQGVLRRKIVTQLEAAIERSESIFGDLLQYAGAAVDTPLFQRFENNLATFVGSLSKPKFHEMRGVFVDNIQMGHDSRETIDAACSLWDRASALDVDTTITAGSSPFENDTQLWIAKAVGKGARTISSILLDLPMEELHARIVILEMLDRGIVQVLGAEPESSEAPTDHGTEADAEDIEDFATVSYSEQDTIYGFDIGAAAKAVKAAKNAAEADTQIDAPVDPEPADEESIEELDLDAEELFDDPSVDESPPEPPPAKPSKARGKTISLAPTSLNQWMEQASVVDEEELDFFADHDHDRGSDDAGHFSSLSHNLDRVEVVGMAAKEGSKEEPLEADEAPTAKFSAPMLGEDEALEKIVVTNEVLAHVVRAFDEAEGAGRGRSVVQLLVDGSPSRFSVLLNDLQITEEGALPEDDVLGNLYSRPATEHRQLINQALVDIIERALSSAADELPDDKFDDMYEAVAGYRQRLGL